MSHKSPGAMCTTASAFDSVFDVSNANTVTNPFTTSGNSQSFQHVPSSYLSHTQIGTSPSTTSHNYPVHRVRHSYKHTPKSTGVKSVIHTCTWVPPSLPYYEEVSNRKRKICTTPCTTVRNSEKFSHTNTHTGTFEHICTFDKSQHIYSSYALFPTSSLLIFHESPEIHLSDASFLTSSLHKLSSPVKSI